MKVQRKPHTTFFPVPPVLVTSQAEGFRPNIITVAWTGVVNSEPPMVSVSIRPDRHTYRLIKASGQFVVNIARADQVREVDLCGVYSGRDTDKFKLTGFTPVKASRVDVPLIKECPVNLECVVRQSYLLGSHEIFIGEVVAVHADEEYIDEHNLIDVAKVNPLAYATPHYWSLGQTLGLYGFTKKEK
ncbi:MAG: hypothetical protein PWQ91_1560 [Eubacteriales bacterium]|nr:hypothetical protein [Eubacteriales bacterium]MDN5364498.1 hypothetical protein [Eubacteriales bacterium]